MVVRELIEQLQKCNPEAEVWITGMDNEKLGHIEKGAINGEDSVPRFWGYKELKDNWAPDEVRYMKQHYPAVCLWPED